MSSSGPAISTPFWSSRSFSSGCLSLLLSDSACSSRGCLLPWLEYILPPRLAPPRPRPEKPPLALNALTGPPGKDIISDGGMPGNGPGKPPPHISSGIANGFMNGGLPGAPMLPSGPPIPTRTGALWDFSARMNIHESIHTFGGNPLIGNAHSHTHHWIHAWRHAHHEAHVSRHGASHHHWIDWERWRSHHIRHHGAVRAFSFCSWSSFFGFKNLDRQSAFGYNGLLRLLGFVGGWFFRSFLGCSLLWLLLVLLMLLLLLASLRLLTIIFSIIVRNGRTRGFRLLFLFSIFECLNRISQCTVGYDLFGIDSFFFAWWAFTVFIEPRRDAYSENALGTFSIKIGSKAKESNERSGRIRA